MLILEHEFRWQKIWWFLSLDRTRPFFRDMWVPVEDAAAFQEQLRTRLAEVADNQTHYNHPQVVNALVHSWFCSAYGTQEQELMVLWGDRVDTRGDGRVAEDLWGHLVSFIARPSQENVPSWVSDLFSELRRKDVVESEAFEKRLESEFQRAQSEWDRSMVTRAASGEENIQDRISLIASLNTFVALWETCCSKLAREQLQTLYELGERLAARKNMADHGVAYPGSWRFELRPFLARFHSPAGAERSSALY